jgi:hypothetical protein
MNSANKLYTVLYSILAMSITNLALHACSKEDVDQVFKSISQPLIVAPIKTISTIYTDSDLLILTEVWKQIAGKQFNVYANRYVKR